jgi:hypothetical protein
MTKSRKLGLIAAATFLAVSCLNRSSSAQQLNFGGTWSGFESYEVTITLGPFMPVETFSGSGPALFTISNNPDFAGSVDVQLDGFFDVPTPYSQINSGGYLLPPDAFGPTSASGSWAFFAGPPGPFTGNFFLTYQSILPDGEIDVGNGTAVADITDTSYEGGQTTVLFASFQSSNLPEPPSIVLAALAILVIGLVAWMRSFHPRPRARQS